VEHRGVTVLDNAPACWSFIPTTLGTDKDFFAEAFIETLWPSMSARRLGKPS